MKLRALLIGVAAAAVAVASGVSAQADEAVYGVLLKTLSNPFWGAMEKGIHDGADAAGAKYFMQAGRNPTRPRSRSSTPATPCSSGNPP